MCSSSGFSFFQKTKNLNVKNKQTKRKTFDFLPTLSTTNTQPTLPNLNCWAQLQLQQQQLQLQQICNNFSFLNDCNCNNYNNNCQTVLPHFDFTFNSIDPPKSNFLNHKLAPNSINWMNQSKPTTNFCNNQFVNKRFINQRLVRSGCGLRSFTYRQAAPAPSSGNKCLKIWFLLTLPAFRTRPSASFTSPRTTARWTRYSTCDLCSQVRQSIP